MKLVTVLCFIAGLTMVAMAADISGKWTAEMEMGGQTRTSTFVFKVDGQNLTGTVTGGRGGEVPIQEGKINGDEISFVVVRNFGGNEMKSTYKGKVAGDQINLTMSIMDRSIELVAKRAQ